MLAGHRPTSLWGTRDANRRSALRLRRGFLFWGLFFVTLGAVPLVVRLGNLDLDRLRDVGLLWPLIIIAVGIGILVSRTHFAVIGVVVAALTLGLIAGSALAFATGGILDFGDCLGVAAGDLQHTSQSGQFGGPASVTLRFSCGDVNVVPGGGTGWSLDADYRGSAPTIDAGSTDLALRAPTNGLRRQDWNVTLPSSALRSLDAELNAAQTALDVSSANLDRFKIVANAGDVEVVGTGASISDLDLVVNAGRARLTLGGPTSGSLQANAGSLEVCVPDNANLTIEARSSFAFDTNLPSSGLAHDGDTWTRGGTGPIIDLEVEGNAAGFTLNPPGGCR
jgi:hypothetical protein